MEQAIDGLVGMFLVGLQAGIPLLSEQLQGLLRSLIGIMLVGGAFAWLAAHLSLFGAAMGAVLRVAVFATLLVSWQYLSGAFIDYSIYGGLTLAGLRGEENVMSVEEFKRPSVVLLRAFDATRPIVTWMKQKVGLGAILSVFTTAVCVIAMHIIWLTFVAIAIHLIWILLLAYIGAGLATLYIPFGVLGPTSFLAARGIAMTLEGAGRLGLAALVTSLIFPFVDSFFLNNSPQQNLDIAGAFWLLAGGLLSLLLSVGLPAVVIKHFTGVPLTAMGMIFPSMGSWAGSGISGSGSSSGSGSGGSRGSRNGSRAGSVGVSGGGGSVPTPASHARASREYEFY